MKTQRVCPEGHKYYKTSDCPVCPSCAAATAKQEAFLMFLSSPARRALKNKGINSAEDLAEYSEHEILELHGVGPSAIPKLRNFLRERGLDFKP